MAEDVRTPAEGEESTETEETKQTEQAVGQAGPDETAILRQELEAAKAKAAENLDGWQRALADLANYKKRVERERAEAYQMTAAAVIARFLPVLDDFERAMKDAPPGDDIKQWVDGMALIQRKLQTIAENEGMTRIEAEGAMFDPNFHEAVTHDASENHTEGQIIEVLRQGYRMGDRVLRPALVRVAK